MRALVLTFVILIACADARAAMQNTLPRRAVLGAALSAGENGAVTVSAVSPDSPAALGGLQPGDVVTRIGDHAVTTPQDFRAAVATSPTGRPTPLAITRR